jgi:DNA polymerase (family X)
MNRANGPGVELLLEVDCEYREKAHAGALPKIAPRRYNPEHEAWLPVLHKHASPWHFTALFSNTERAHGLHRTYDWVVIFFSDGDRDDEGQATVVTEYRGDLKGHRVVRGREPECARHYAASASRAREFVSARRF